MNKEILDSLIGKHWVDAVKTVKLIQYSNAKTYSTYAVTDDYLKKHAEKLHKILRNDRVILVIDKHMYVKEAYIG